jgi:chloramphenicol 3-O-phosphotransferase
LVVVLNGPSGSGKSTLAMAIQQTAITPWIRLLPDEFAQWHLPEQYWAFGQAAGPWQEGFFGALAALARVGNQVITCAGGLDDRAGWQSTPRAMSVSHGAVLRQLRQCWRRGPVVDRVVAGALR